jgi:hypothetical protein
MPGGAPDLLDLLLDGHRPPLQLFLDYTRSIPIFGNSDITESILLLDF